jgi:hypothetical protein
MPNRGPAPVSDLWHDPSVTDRANSSTDPGAPQRLADDLVALSEQVRALGAGPTAPASGATPHLSDGLFIPLPRSEIDGYLTDLVAGSREELLAAQPQINRGAAALASAMVRDIAALERGVRIRTLYQHSARHSPTEQQYVDRVAPLGAEIRTLDEFFDRMIIVDREVAVIPGPHGTSSAVAVREPAVVRFLVTTFERTWERARPFTASDEETVQQIAEGRRAMTVRMLREGHADAQAARRMGVSPRTYASYVADLRSEYGAHTSCQLGFTMGRLGVTGSASDDTDT